MTGFSRERTYLTDAPDFLVLGAGLIGLACARALHNRGFRVEVLEAARPGFGASTAAAGMISPMFESDNSTLINTSLESRNLWRDWAAQLGDETGLDLGFEESGSIVAELTDQDQADNQDLEQLANRLEEPYERWSAEEVLEEVPTFNSKVRGALFFPNEFRVSPSQVVTALHRWLTARHIPVHLQRRVERIRAQRSVIELSGSSWRSEVKGVVVASGAWTSQIEGDWHAPVRPIRGQMVSYSGLDWRLAKSVRCGQSYALSRGDQLVFGATVEDVGFEEAATEDGRRHLDEAAQDLFPTLKWKAIARHWAGLRPASPDGLPIIGPLRDEPRVLMATGHFRNGILLTPWTAEKIAGIAAEDDDAVVEPFLPARF